MRGAAKRKARLKMVTLQEEQGINIYKYKSLNILKAAYNDIKEIYADHISFLCKLCC